MIADRSTHNPAMHMDATSGFQNVTSDGYWSSTTGASVSGVAWVVGFYCGADYWNFKAHSNYVRCVRGGQIVPSTPPAAVSVPLSSEATFALMLLFGLSGFWFMRRRAA